MRGPRWGGRATSIYGIRGRVSAVQWRGRPRLPAGGVRRGAPEVVGAPLRPVSRSVRGHGRCCRVSGVFRPRGCWSRGPGDGPGGPGHHIGGGCHIRLCPGRCPDMLVQHLQITAEGAQPIAERAEIFGGRDELAGQARDECRIHRSRHDSMVGRGRVGWMSRTTRIDAVGYSSSGDSFRWRIRARA